MIVTTLFILLAAIALVGAGGISLCRSGSRCGLSFLLCCLAVAGLFSLLNMRYVAVVQLVTSVCVAGVLQMFSTTGRIVRVRIPGALSYASAGLVFLSLTIWAIAHGTLGESVLRALPIWAVPGEHLSALGRELLERYTILLALSALLLLTGMLAAAYMLRQRTARRQKGSADDPA